MATKAYTSGNYFYLKLEGITEPLGDSKSNVVVWESNAATNEFTISGPNLGTHSVLLSNLIDSTDTPFTALTWKTFYESNSGFDLASLSGAVNTGWAVYGDTQYTSGSPFILLGNVNAYTDLPNNALSKLEIQKPEYIPTYYDATTQKILGREGDSIAWSIEFKASTAVNNTWLEIGIDIGGGIPILYPDTFTFPRGTGEVRSIIYAIPAAYTLDTWESNGGSVKIKSDNAVTIHSIRYVFNTTHKAR